MSRWLPTQVNLPMACQCKPERRAALDALVNGRTATQLLHELHWEHGYTLDYIGVDMWMGARATHWDSEDDEPTHAPIRIEFDVLEHGLATLIEYLDAEKKAKADG